MNCKDIKENLVSMLYGELEPDKAKQIQSHLKTCSSCRQTYKELKETVKLLERWKDENPEVNFLFVTEPASIWKKWGEKIRQFGWKTCLALGIPMAAVAILLFLAILNFRIHYNNGEWNLSFSLIPRKEEIDQKNEFTKALTELQKETLLLTSRMIKESEYRQKQTFALTLSQFAQNLEKQRQRDLALIEHTLQGLNLSTEGKFAQTNKVLADLIYLTSYTMEKPNQ